jgi:hypothetical protein
LLLALFVPSQGFFNFVVYNRPRYRLVRRSFPGCSRWWALSKVVWNGNSNRRRRWAVLPKENEQNTSESLPQPEGDSPENADVNQQPDQLVDSNTARGDHAAGQHSPAGLDTAGFKAETP